LFLASKLSEPHDEVVLEIGTGSGIQAICMAKRAKHVVATDINDKALLYARFNANLNAVGDKIEFLNGDVYEKFNGERFNRIVSNSAVIPAPINSGFFVHSDGGPLGIDMSKKIIDGAITHLVDDGKLQMLCTSFSDRNKEFIMTKIIKDSYQNLNCQFSMVELYDNPLEPLNLLTDNFKHLYSYTAFKSNIVKNGYKQLHYLYLETNNDSSKCFDIKYELSNRLFQPDAYSGSWKGRMSRLFLAYNAELMELVPLDS
jgi:ubiquinone/menaquinone biosynthesis C-methylase UbiE